MKKLLILVFSLIISINASAYEVRDVCATYSNTGKSYAVQGNINKGSELNSKTSSWNYNSWSTYVVIFWSNSQTTVIELDYYFGGMTFGVSGTDQEGYPWEVQDGHMFCY